MNKLMAWIIIPIAAFFGYGIGLLVGYPVHCGAVGYIMGFFPIAGKDPNAESWE